jgi:hypothetical protein
MTEETKDNQQNQAAQKDLSGQGVTGIPNINFNRKFRRALLKQSGYVKIKNRLGYKDWFENIKNNIQNGKQLHATNTEDVIRKSKERAEKANESLAEFLLSKGYSEERAGDIIEESNLIKERIALKKLNK